MRCGDPEQVPVLFSPGFEVAASYLGKDEGEITWADAIRTAEETGTHNFAHLHSPLPREDDPAIRALGTREAQGGISQDYHITPRLINVFLLYVHRLSAPDHPIREPEHPSRLQRYPHRTP